MHQTGQETTSTHKPVTKCLENISEAGYKCVCLNARSIVNKKNELNFMVQHIAPHIIGITESWANIDIADAEFLQMSQLQVMQSSQHEPRHSVYRTR